jgi:oligopeptide/dipeptide ABC transporter ATP-binding protein
MSALPESLCEIRALKKYFPVRHAFHARRRDFLKAVNGVDLAIHRGETLGLVGESGCGKSTLGRLIIRLWEPTSGAISFSGKDIFSFGNRELKEYRRRVQMIFQDPYASLNPRRTAASIIGEPLFIHAAADRAKSTQRIAEIMERVGLSPEQARRYPHEFSGGQRQRIGIARAVILRPDLIIADEPVSALDVSIQAQILGLMKNLQWDFGLTYLFISHDLSVIRYMSDRVAVMYLGKIVEQAPSAALYARPQHPYTLALLSAVPVPDPLRKKKRMILWGDIPSPVAPPPGCQFHTRCPFRFEICDKIEPLLRERGGGHFAACHLDEIPDVQTDRAALGE